MFPHRRFPIKQGAWGACDYEATELTLAFHHRPCGRYKPMCQRKRSSGLPNPDQSW